MLYRIWCAFIGLATAFPSAGYVPKGSDCLDFIIPVTVTSNNRPWIAPKWENNLEFIDFLSTASSRPSAGFPAPVGDNPVNQTGSYEIGATFCTPQTTPTPTPGNHSDNTVIIATHGLGFDRSYWNFPYEPEKYNFAQFAINKGYSIFFYDRLGTGISSKISGFDAQLNLEIAILSSLVKSVKAGSYSSTALPHSPKSVVLVGHSFGSWVSNGLVANEPDSTSAVVLTGYSLNPIGSNPPVILQGFAPRIARLERPGRDDFAAYDTGYLTTADLFSTINQFFKAPDYDTEVTIYAEETKTPFAIAEIESLDPAFANNDAGRAGFKGAALVATGERDLLFCAGLCTEELLAVPLKDLFNGAKAFETYIQPGAGHGLALAKNARDGFERIFDFLDRVV